MATNDPVTRAHFEKALQNITENQRIAALVGMIYDACLPEGEDLSQALSQMPQPYADILLIDWLNAEQLNGSMHQFFYNSSGDHAPDIAFALQRAGLPDHAAALEKGMAHIGTPYPTDRATRLNIMHDFSEQQDDLLYNLTSIIDDGRLYDAMRFLAEESGMWPE